MSEQHGEIADLIEAGDVNVDVDEFKGDDVVVSAVSIHDDDIDAVSDGAYQQPIDATWTEPLAIPVTGDERVDDALTLLSGLSDLDVHDHADVLEDVHNRLRAVLIDGANA